MSCGATYARGLCAVILDFWPATMVMADDQRLVQDYLQSHGAGGATVRAIVDDYVGRAFPNFSFFGVISFFVGPPGGIVPHSLRAFFFFSGGS